MRLIPCIHFERADESQEQFEFATTTFTNYIPTSMKTSLRFTPLLALLTTSLVARAAESEPLSAPWKHLDVGEVEVHGSAEFDQGVFTLKGTLDTWGTNDGFHFVWQTFRGDGQIVARVLSV